MTTCKRCGTELDLLGREDGGWTLHTYDRCVAALLQRIAAAREALDYARLAAKWLGDHADRAHEYDRGYIDEVNRRIATAIAVLKGPTP